MLEYLECLPGLDLRLEACNATSHEETRVLIKSLEEPLGGCFLLTAVLNDRLFMKHTIETFNVTWNSKFEAFRTIESVVDIGSLDFFVFVSSAMALGSLGQTNYGS